MFRKQLGKIWLLFLSFNVYFDEWRSFTTDAADDDEPSSELLRAGHHLLFLFLNYTFQSKILRVGESKELTMLESTLNMVLPPSFGFKFLPGTSQHDFVIQRNDESPENEDERSFIICGAGKESSMLPRKCVDHPSDLCLFGFATRIVTKARSHRSSVITA